MRPGGARKAAELQRRPDSRFGGYRGFGGPAPRFGLAAAARTPENRVPQAKFPLSRRFLPLTAPARGTILCAVRRNRGCGPRLPDYGGAAQRSGIRVMNGTGRLGRVARLCLCLCLCLFAPRALGAAANFDRHAEPTPAPAEFAAAVSVHDVAVAEGQTLGGILLAAGVARADALSAAAALGGVADLLRILPGQELSLYLAPLPAGGQRLVGIALALRGGRAAVAYRNFDDRFKARRMPRADAADFLDSIRDLPDGGETGAMTRDLALPRGGTLHRLLIDNGAAPQDVGEALRALSRSVDLKLLPVGQIVAITFEREAGRPPRLAAVALPAHDGTTHFAERGGDGTWRGAAPDGAAADAPSRSEAPRAPGGAETRRFRFARGDTFGALLARAGASGADIDAAARSLRGAYDIRRIPVGGVLSVAIDRSSGASRLASAALDAGRDGFALERAPDGGFRAVGRRSAGAAEAPPAAALETRIGAAPVAALAETGFTEIAIGRGDTLIGILRRAGFSMADCRAAADAAKTVYNLRKLRAGGRIEHRAAAGPADSGDAAESGESAESAAPPLGAVRIHVDAASRVDVVRLEDGSYAAGFVEKRLYRALRRVAGVVDRNFHGALSAAGAPANIISAAARILGYSVDFQRDVRSGDEFSIVFESFLDEDGDEAMFGDVEYASMVLSDKPFTLYRYEFPDGRHDYFDKNGRSGRKALMRTPIDGARLTSGFGSRRHPISGFTRMHRGVDFGAPAGTPIYAAGDGIVERAGRNGGYGRYIRIRHNGMYKTVYAHMSRFAAGVRAGKRVSQGDTIGYVGSSGLSTGPHLHYEVIYDGKQVNPLSIELPLGEPLDSSDLVAFTPHRRALDRLSRELPLGTPVAFGDRRIAEFPVFASSRPR